MSRIAKSFSALKRSELVAIIKIALEEAYKSEVIDTDMEDLEEQSKEDWILDRLDNWIDDIA